MKICIISDLHCKYQLNTSEATYTLLLTTKPRIPSTQHPVASMLNLIDKDPHFKNNTDILLCLGDIGDKADEQGIASGWIFVEEICSRLGAKLCLGIPGNHDINSRKHNAKDAFSYIKNFHENFPTKSPELNNQFWGSGYCIVTYQKCLILLINSVHDHIDEEAANHTSLQSSSLEKISNELNKFKLGEYDYKLCIIHHHPIKHSNIINAKDSDSIENGDDLINKLNRLNFNIVIHGHKHQPRIVEYSGMPIFATGSFSCFANLQGSGIDTMFHLLELNPNTKLGTIESWEYDINNGWSQKLNSIFPPSIGFGAELDIQKTAEQISELFDRNGKNPILYQDVIKNIKEINYLIPEKLIQLKNILKEKYYITTKPEYPLQPDIVTEYTNKM
jgi:calcineurin-like phosphoesterase family protein